MTAAWLARLGERRSAERKGVSQIPAGPTTRVVKKTGDIMLAVI